MELHPSFRKEARNRQYEIADNGIYLPKAKVFIGGVFEHEVRRNGQLLGKRRDPNIVVNEGLNHLLNVLIKGATQVDPWYIGIFKGNYTPAAGDTAANIASNSTEATEYDEGTRVEYEEGSVSSQSVDNSGDRAVFTINDTVTIYGAFLASLSTKSGTTGTLLAASRFASSRALVASDQLLVTYTLSASNA